MDALFPRCAGLDVHKANVVARVRIVGPIGKLAKQVRTLFTVTHALHTMPRDRPALRSRRVSPRRDQGIRVRLEPSRQLP
jgi:hypothetical protein